jgi:tRNA-dihydrouridine synthase
VAQIAYDEGMSWVAIHGRTRAQGYAGLSDWQYIAHVKASAKLPILGNGDILSADQAVERLRETGCDGVMIGRGCLKNPWIFREALGLWHDHGASINPDRNFFGLFQKLKYYLEQNCDERIVLIQLRKFAAWYSSGYPGASNFRKHIFQIQSTDELMEITCSFFVALEQVAQQDTSGESFLMGGHG